MPCMCHKSTHVNNRCWLLLDFLALVHFCFRMFLSQLNVFRDRTNTSTGPEDLECATYIYWYSSYISSLRTYHQLPLHHIGGVTSSLSDWSMLLRACFLSQSNVPRVRNINVTSTDVQEKCITNINCFSSVNSCLSTFRIFY